MPDPRTPTLASPPHTLGRFVAVALVFPAALAVAAVIAQLVILPRVPDVIATHWNAAGDPDGFSPAWLSPLLTAVLCLGVPALIGLCALPGLRRGDRGASYRLLGAISAGTSVLLAALPTWALILQIDVTDVTTVRLPFWPTIAILFALAAASGVLAWLVQPRDYSDDATTASAPPLPLAATERAVWMRHVSIARPGVVVISAAVVLVAGLAAGSWFVADPVLAAVLSVVAVLLLVLSATTVAFHVRVDDAGLAVDSALGLPRFRVPIDDIERVAVVEVNPLGEFGGWGLRFGAGHRFGVVLRKGEAIQVARSNGREFVVTVDDAATAASLLEALRRRPAESQRSALPVDDEG